MEEYVDRTWMNQFPASVSRYSSANHEALLQKLLKR